MKFSPLIDFMKNIFLENPFRKFSRETSPRLIFKKSKLIIFVGQQAEVLYSLLLLSVKDCQNMLKLRRQPFTFTSHKGFLKNKKRSEISPLASFSA